MLTLEIRLILLDYIVLLEAICSICKWHYTAMFTFLVSYEMAVISRKVVYFSFYLQRQVNRQFIVSLL